MRKLPLVALVLLMAGAEKLQAGVPLGACCTGVGCTFTNPEACTALGGIYKGDNVPCSPDPCIPAVSDWGMVILGLLVLNAGTIIHLRRQAG